VRAEALALRLAGGDGELGGGRGGKGELMSEGGAREWRAGDGEEGRIGFLSRVEWLSSRRNGDRGHFWRVYCRVGVV